LVRLYHCEAATNAYAIDYAERFCRVYDEQKALLSPAAQKWVYDVRKCLQATLEPLVLPWASPTCHEIRQKALASQTTCYLTPVKDAMLTVFSICSLDCSDYFKIFWSIKRSFRKLDTAWESLKGLWNTEKTCGVDSQISSCSFKEGTKELIKITRLVVQKFNQGERRLTDSLPEADLQSRFVDGIGQAIANTLKWKTDVMEWLAYSGNMNDASDNLDVLLVLADMKALGIVTTSITSVNLDQTIQEFASEVENGSLPLQVDGYNVWVKSLALCSDKSCHQAQTLAISDKPPKWNSVTIISHGGHVGLVGAIAVLIMCEASIF